MVKTDNKLKISKNKHSRTLSKNRPASKTLTELHEKYLLHLFNKACTYFYMYLHVMYLLLQ